MKTNEAKLKANRNYKERNFKNQRCRDCSKPTEPNKIRCKIHERWNSIRRKAKYQFMKDFT